MYKYPNQNQNNNDQYNIHADFTGVSMLRQDILETVIGLFIGLFSPLEIIVNIGHQLITWMDGFPHIL
jgi:hypothetical protein